MAQTLKDVIVLPMGGGKTTTKSHDEYYLDFDEMYSLEETEETYKRVNLQILDLLDGDEPIPADFMIDHRRRISEYNGNSRCLMVHSLAVASIGGLNIRKILVPSPKLHEKAIETRTDRSKKLARLNRESILSECTAAGLTPHLFNDWETLNAALREIKVDETAKSESDGSSVTSFSRSASLDSGSSQAGALDDEHCIANLVALSLGAKSEVSL